MAAEHLLEIIAAHLLLGKQLLMQFAGRFGVGAAQGAKTRAASAIRRGWQSAKCWARQAWGLQKSQRPHRLAAVGQVAEVAHERGHAALLRFGLARDQLDLYAVDDRTAQCKIAASPGGRG